MYEGMFLLDAGQPSFETASEPVISVLHRSKAEIVSIKPWDERRLAYQIAGRNHGLYVLTYFNVDPQRIQEIEHDCQLDERIVRSLLVRRDELTDEELNAETPATASKKRAAARAAVKAEPEVDQAKEAPAGAEPEVDQAKEAPADAEPEADQAKEPDSAAKDDTKTPDNQQPAAN